MYRIDEKFPEFKLESYDPRKDSEGTIGNQGFKNKFIVLFFYPADFTFVCPTELADMARRYKEFKNLHTEIIGVSTDSVYTHRAWIKTEELMKSVSFPLASDRNGRLSRELGIYDEEKGLSARAAFIIDPDGILRAVDITADQIGRSAGEILRKVKALQFVRTHKGQVCPASWDEGMLTLKPSIKISGKVGENLKKGNR